MCFWGTKKHEPLSWTLIHCHIMLNGKMSSFLRTGGLLGSYMLLMPQREIIFRSYEKTKSILYVPHEYNMEGRIEVGSLIKRFSAIQLFPHWCLIFISLMLGEKGHFSDSSPSRSLIQSWNSPNDVTLTSQLPSSNMTKLILNIISSHTKKSRIGREPEMLTHSYNGIMASLMMCSYVEETAPWCLSPTSFFSLPLLCTQANRGHRLQPAT